jgi:hypothetical protein
MRPFAKDGSVSTPIAAADAGQISTSVNAKIAFFRLTLRANGAGLLLPSSRLERVPSCGTFVQCHDDYVGSIRLG